MDLGRDEYLTPVDVTAAAKVIAEEWVRATDKAIHLYRSGERWPPHGLGGRVLIEEKVAAVLRSYDETRTRQIAFLKAEVRRLLSLVPGPPLVIEKREGTD